ncbi:MAG: prepilin-type N-terminal cleavage/methylation domain-containing protein [Alphaproteobacteria bacterium]|nr:MAG: prepilin-type N-terminal cleavage/methylation domain-containing protein [Alphaproteobacteria bacterium]
MTKKIVITAFSRHALPKPHQHGFSLFEAAVVLAIIGILITGVMAGRDLLTASKHRNIATKAYEYVDAVEKFHDKFQALPGDMPHATRIWGRADGHASVDQQCASPALNNSNPQGTCNGDGDGSIARHASPLTVYEMFRAWQQLSLGGYIQGNFTGIAGASGWFHAQAGSNIPASDVRASGYDLVYLDESSLTSRHFTGINYNHVLHFGRNQTGNNLAHGVTIPVVEARNIDKKFDDAMPGMGKIVAFTDTSCVTTPVASSADYIRNDQKEVRHCALIFITGF